MHRIGSGLGRDGKCLVRRALSRYRYAVYGLTASLILDSVLSSPRILNVPLLLLANKQDTPMSMSAAEIRQDYEVWDHHRRDSARRRYAEEEGEEEERKKMRIASLEVLGVSALEGYVLLFCSLAAS